MKSNATKRFTHNKGANHIFYSSAQFDHVQLIQFNTWNKINTSMTIISSKLSRTALCTRQRRSHYFSFTPEIWKIYPFFLGRKRVEFKYVSLLYTPIHKLRGRRISYECVFLISWCQIVLLSFFKYKWHRCMCIFHCVVCRRRVH